MDDDSEPDSRTLIFTPITLDDKPYLSRLLKNRDIAQNFVKGSEYLDSEIGDILDKMLHFWINNNLGFYMVKQNDQMIGIAGFNYLSDYDEVEVVYCVDKHLWGQGLATLVLKKLMKIGIEEFNLSKLLGVVKEENLGSYKVLEKNGFNFVKKFKEHGQNYILLEVNNILGTHKTFLNPKEVGL